MHAQCQRPTDGVKRCIGGVDAHVQRCPARLTVLPRLQAVIYFGAGPLATIAEGASVFSGGVRAGVDHTF